MRATAFIVVLAIGAQVRARLSRARVRRAVTAEFCRNPVARRIWRVRCPAGFPGRVRASDFQQRHLNHGVHMGSGGGHSMFRKRRGQREQPL